MLLNIAKNFSALMVSQVGYKLLSFVSIAYVARKIGDVKFGQLSFALYLGLLFFALADMGQSEVYICETAGNRAVERKIMGVSTGNRITLSLFAFLLLIICAFLFSPGPGCTVLVLLAGLSMIIDSFTLYLRSVFRAREKMEYEAASFMIEGLVKFILLVFTVIIFKSNLSFIGIALLITSAVSFLITMLICKKKFFLAAPIFKKSFFVKFFKRGLPFAVIGFLSIISLKIDVVMLSKMGPDSVTGLYSAAVRLIESLLVIPVTLSVVLFPVVSRIHRNSKMSFFSLYKISSVSSLAMGILVSFLLYASSGLFIRYIFGSGFLNSVYLAKILSFIFIPFFLKLFLERSALVLGKFDILLKAYIGGVILKIVLNLFFMRAMDYRGVALTSIFTEAAVALFVYCLLRRYFWERLILPENDASTNTWDLLHEKE